MGGVLERIRWLHRWSPGELLPTPPVDPTLLELQAAKEILAEVFQIRVFDVDEMILNRYNGVRYVENNSEEEQWPMEFQLEG